MAKLLHYFAHPGERYSKANRALFKAAKTVRGITSIDLYEEYPRHNIDVEAEQALLLEHDVILFQFPILWYSTPSLIKEWIDLVLEYGWAYGEGGTRLKGKVLMLALTTGAPENAYSDTGYQHHSLRTFLTPLEQTARLCGMRFATPYVLYGARHADIPPHVDGFVRLLSAIRDDAYDFDRAEALETVGFQNLPIKEAVSS